MEVTSKNMELLAGAMNEMTNRGYIKLIHAYLKKIDKDFSETDTYLKKYTEKQFIEQLKEHYDIRGKVNFDKIAKAKLKSDDMIPPEKDEQKDFVKWLRDENKLRPADKKWIITASLNGVYLKGSDSYKYIASLKSQGLDPDEPDIKISVGNGLTIYIEMKRIKGSKVSPEQESRVKWYKDNGYPAKICFGCQDAIRFFKEIIST
jgi:hypothetical protein